MKSRFLPRSPPPRTVGLCGSATSRISIRRRRRTISRRRSRLEFVDNHAPMGNINAIVHKRPQIFIVHKWKMGRRTGDRLPVCGAIGGRAADLYLRLWTVVNNWSLWTIMLRWGIQIQLSTNVRKSSLSTNGKWDGGLETAAPLRLSMRFRSASLSSFCWKSRRKRLMSKWATICHFRE